VKKTLCRYVWTSNKPQKEQRTTRNEKKQHPRTLLQAATSSHPLGPSSQIAQSRLAPGNAQLLENVAFGPDSGHEGTFGQLFALAVPRHVLRAFEGGPSQFLTELQEESQPQTRTTYLVETALVEAVPVLASLEADRAVKVVVARKVDQRSRHLFPRYPEDVDPPDFGPGAVRQPTQSVHFRVEAVPLVRFRERRDCDAGTFHRAPELGDVTGVGLAVRAGPFASDEEVNVARVFGAAAIRAHALDLDFRVNLLGCYGRYMSSSAQWDSGDTK
jgi:hypothetical protein